MEGVGLGPTDSLQSSLLLTSVVSENLFKKVQVILQLLNIWILCWNLFKKVYRSKSSSKFYNC